MSGRIDPDDGEGWENLIAEADTKDYALAKSRRREIILEKTGDGRLLFVSHRYL